MNSWNNWGGKGLLVCNPPHETGPVRAGCCVPCEVKIWVYPRLEIPPPLQASLPVTDHPRGEKLFLTSESEWSFLQIVSSCLLCTTEWLDRRSALLLQGEPAHDPLSSLRLPLFSSPDHCKDLLWSPARICVFLLLYTVSLCFISSSRSLWIVRRWHPRKDAKEWRTAARCQRVRTGSVHTMLAGECGQRTAVFAASR